MAVTTLHVCVTCRTQPLDHSVRAGQRLHAMVGARLKQGDVVLHEAQCLSACARSCVASISAPGKWSYVIGGLDEEAAGELIAFAQIHAIEPTGNVPKPHRPDRLKDSVLGRVPSSSP